MSRIQCDSFSVAPSNSISTATPSADQPAATLTSGSEAEERRGDSADHQRRGKLSERGDDERADLAAFRLTAAHSRVRRARPAVTRISTVPRNAISRCDSPHRIRLAVVASTGSAWPDGLLRAQPQHGRDRVAGGDQAVETHDRGEVGVGEGRLGRRGGR